MSNNNFLTKKNIFPPASQEEIKQHYDNYPMMVDNRSLETVLSQVLPLNLSHPRVIEKITRKSAAGNLSRIYSKLEDYNLFNVLWDLPWQEQSWYEDRFGKVKDSLMQIYSDFIHEGRLYFFQVHSLGLVASDNLVELNHSKYLSILPESLFDVNIHKKEFEGILKSVLQYMVTDDRSTGIKTNSPLEESAFASLVDNVIEAWFMGPNSIFEYNPSENTFKINSIEYANLYLLCYPNFKIFEDCQNVHSVDNFYEQMLISLDEKEEDLIITQMQRFIQYKKIYPLPHQMDLIRIRDFYHQHFKPHNLSEGLINIPKQIEK